MAVLTIRTYGDSCLRIKSLPVQEINEQIKGLAQEMGETLYTHRGIGLAAPQVGVNLRLFVCDLDWVDREEGEETGKRNLKVMINPEIVAESDTDSPLVEGCLSLPGLEGEVYRPSQVRIRYQNLQGEWQEYEAEGLEAKCLQHELDHLNGVLFIDRMPFLKRRLLAGKLNQLKQKTEVVA